MKLNCRLSRCLNINLHYRVRKLKVKSKFKSKRFTNSSRESWDNSIKNSGQLKIFYSCYVQHGSKHVHCEPPSSENESPGHLTHELATTKVPVVAKFGDAFYFDKFLWLPYISYEFNFNLL